MDGKKDKLKGYLELKKLGAEKLLRLASNRLFIDIRKVRRFRIWQGEYLNHVMGGIALMNSEKQEKLKIKYLNFLNFILLKHIQRALYKWSSIVKYFKIFTLPNTKFKSAITTCSVLIKQETNNLGRKDFPLFYCKSQSWKMSRVKVALSKWRQKVVNTLLDESHREMAIVKINHFLHKKTTPLTSFAIRKICYRIGAKIGCNVLFLSIKKIIQQHKHYSFMCLGRKKSIFTPRSRVNREKKAKLNLLQKFVAIKHLNSIANKKYSVPLLKVKVFFAFCHWKKLKKRPKARIQRRLKGADRKIKQLAANFIMRKSRTLEKKGLMGWITHWKSTPKAEAVFSIDKFVYINQAQVAAYIEGQIISQVHQIKKLKRGIQLQNMELLLRKQLKDIFGEWANLMRQERNKTNDQDIVYEYIHFLEDNLGVPHKFRH
ncbi:hypothetical protein SteCoe_12835 [Stentor coeruleus]|uniref:Uncharacterized protein n=1 Tax=Stentor coeruleus TaxID=5963 RepID=A0A1R2C9T3_9CILI|nr:hypothetical protein SteCoe_12835 [Stentor coeruleus]